MSVFRVGICGTTEYTVSCVEALARDSRYQIEWVVTPMPKPVGRKQELTPSALEVWAKSKNLPIYSVEKNLKPLKESLLSAAPIDFLLVVDFGYIVPNWLITLPSIAPINIHPSDLPRYRGSSPGQYVLLSGEKESAMCIMRLTAGLDEGPIIARLPISIVDSDTQETYYRRAFEMAQAVLAVTLEEYSRKKQEFPQTPQSPTPTAARLAREDGFVPWNEVNLAFTAPAKKLSESDLINFGSAVQKLIAPNSVTRPELIDRLVRAFSPWPGCWTIVPSYKERTDVRLKFLESALVDGQLSITSWQYEGETPTAGRWQP